MTFFHLKTFGCLGKQKNHVIFIQNGHSESCGGSAQMQAWVRKTHKGKVYSTLDEGA